MIRWATVDAKALQRKEKEEAEEEKNKQEEAPDPEEMLRQYYESELPVEYTQLKRELDEDGLQEIESDAKRVKADTEQLYIGHYPENTNTQTDMSAYGYAQPPQQQQVYQAYSTDVSNNQQTTQKAGGIIPENVLHSLKKFSRPAQATKPAESKSASGGLGTLANYGSDSEDEDE